MKIINDIKKILDSYNTLVVIPDEFKTVYEYEKKFPNVVNDEFKHEYINDNYLINKYKKNIDKGHYGFDIGTPTPRNWFIVIDKVIETLINYDPNLKIQQIKMKFGGIRFYVTSEIIEDILEIEILISKTLFSEKLIY